MYDLEQLLGVEPKALAPTREARISLGAIMMRACGDLPALECYWSESNGNRGTRAILN